ncbi:polyadenylate-binding protein 1 [Actinidia rufa]|uniref:Polyadenylate-binding protein 1 n=1 Tax=Actinidia rufa TaxID=165716 RepID=A0A7J0E688_9ERIC|nr:polyadenylate-binding protein 1 [Actinidia rufa]
MRRRIARNGLSFGEDRTTRASCGRGRFGAWPCQRVSARPSGRRRGEAATAVAVASLLPPWFAACDFCGRWPEFDGEMSAVNAGCYRILRHLFSCPVSIIPKRITASPRPCSGRRVVAKKRPRSRVDGFVNSVKKIQRREICSKRDRGFSMSDAQERFRNIRLQNISTLPASSSSDKFSVDYACTPEEVQQHFQSCGTVNRVTILTDKFGQPKGFAYVEFVEFEAVQNALLLNESELHGRQLKVSAKRTNVPEGFQGSGGPCGTDLTDFASCSNPWPEDLLSCSSCGFTHEEAISKLSYCGDISRCFFGHGERIISYELVPSSGIPNGQTSFDFASVSTIDDRQVRARVLAMASNQETDDSANTLSSPKNMYKDPDDGRQRFLLELEFVQCLANPIYIHCPYLNLLLHPPASVPPPPSIAPTTISVSAVPPPLPASAPSPALSPMQYAIPPGSALAKNDPRNSGVDRRKRKYALSSLVL